ncbi:MAG: hypothetical protein LUC97_06440 [Clostridiales bacterium]|nr:hypothetical protein [Clostridiales bacterium]
MTRQELETKVNELRENKAILEEVQNLVKALEHEIIGYMVNNNLDTEITETAKITYKTQSRKGLDKEKLTEALGTEGIKKYEKVTTYNVLRVK